MKPVSQTRIIVGLSGGVDSSVAALLLQKQGYQVEGVFMQNWEEEGQPQFCSADVDLKDAQSVCTHLGIPFHAISFAKEYWDHVFTHFLDEYAAGRTPNPDILCNKEIKFKAFLQYARAQGADYIATGHYVRKHLENGAYQLLKAVDASKDQSYFLYTLQKEQLEKSLFPLGALHKTEVRKIAQAAGFAHHAKKDSTGICFIGERRFSTFLGEYLLARPGNIETVEGKIIGRHNGLMFYTMGQRKGLGIGGGKGEKDAPWYVVQKDIDRQVLVVAQTHDHPLLLRDQLECNQLHWVAGHPPPTPWHGTAKIRYRQKDADCTLDTISTDTYSVQFAEPQWAITPGQSVVFYKEDVCLGGGVII